jgi:hypothetical protein
MIPTLAPVRRLATVLLPLAAVLLLPAATVADDFISRANDLYRTIREANRSDLILLPAVAQMEKPPAPVADPEKAMLLPATAAAFPAAREWAAAEPQRAVLAALSEAAYSESRHNVKAFGQPYGVDAVAATGEGIAMVRAGLYTELGDPPILAAAKFQYLPALENVACLVHVEATGRLADGDIGGAIDVVIDWLLFARQIADREFFQEKRWGLRQTTAALERIRDLAYQDFRSQRTLRADQISSIMERLSADHADLNGERISFPRADRVGADQIIALTFTPRGEANAQFAPILARLASHERPLRLFAEAAAWEQYAGMHANWFDTKERAEQVYNEWASRWPLDSFDPRQTLPTDYDRTSKTRFALIFAAFPNMQILMNDRQVVRAHVAGTRTSLGILGLFYRAGNFPPDVSAIRPAYVRTLDPDPFNRARSRPPLEYFVPIRDQRFGPRDEPRPHTVNVVARRGQYPFQVRLGQDQFILYSVGPDNSKGWATIASDEPEKDSAGDLLLWPPVSSLLRQRLIETGELK